MKYNEYTVPKRKTALDLEVDLSKPEHLKSLRETATQIAQLGSHDSQQRTWLSSRPTTALTKHIKKAHTSSQDIITSIGVTDSMPELPTPCLSQAETR